MGEVTGISWTDSTYNAWEGCTKVGPGCDHCYAADRDIRYHGGSHWGAGAPRKRMSEHTRNNPYRWNRKAAEFMKVHGHHQRVFCSSLADVFDNEVPQEWREEAFATMEATPELRWQLCTKRVGNIAKMVLERWGSNDVQWPRNVGVLITVVTPEEMLRDVPKLTDLKRRFDIPWIGLSIEPMIADVADALTELTTLGILQQVDWAIFGGESGPDARDCHVAWIIAGLWAAQKAGVTCFVKQLGAKARMMGGAAYLELQDAAGKNPAEWPIGHSVLQTRDFPAALY